MPRAALLAVVLLAGSCQDRPPASPSPEPRVEPDVPAAAPLREPERLRVQILSTRSHDPRAFTQGLVWHEGKLYESTGNYGSSSLREVDPKTGEVRRFLPVPQQYFAEGLARVDDRLIQLTWQEGVALVYNLATFEESGQLPYSGEGWGLCHDGRRLVMSDGSDRLTFRDPATFEIQGGVNVTAAGQPVFSLNELECVDGAVWANIWQTEEIVRIDPATGQVTAVVDASGLLTPQERQTVDVLNGIAWVPETKTFLITGKYWPKMFEVAFQPQP